MFTIIGRVSRSIPFKTEKCEALPFKKFLGSGKRRVLSDVDLPSSIHSFHAELRSSTVQSEMLRQCITVS